MSRSPPATSEQTAVDNEVALKDYQPTTEPAASTSMVRIAFVPQLVIDKEVQSGDTEILFDIPVEDVQTTEGTLPKHGSQQLRHLLGHDAAPETVTAWADTPYPYLLYGKGVY